MSFFDTHISKSDIHSLWCERYRPTTLNDYVGNDLIKAKVADYIDSNDIPHLLFYGKAGGGKTTIAKIIVSNIDCDYIYINASDERGIDTIRTKIKNFVTSVGFSSLKVVILDEADYLTPDAQASLRNLMETFSKHSRFILTCNYVDKIIDPLQSRCHPFEVIPPSKKETVKQAIRILNNEAIEFELVDIAKIVNKTYPDIRRLINNIQMLSSGGKLELDEETLIESGVSEKIIEILKSSSSNKFNEIRQLVADSRIQHFDDIYSTLYTEVDSYANSLFSYNKTAQGKSNNAVAAVIVLIATAQRDDVMVVDKEINFMACIAQIINEI